MSTNTDKTVTTETFVQSLVDLGAEWAMFGISIGKDALVRSAKSLELAAKSLGTISEQLEKKLAHNDQEVHPAEVVSEHDESKAA